MGNEDKSGYLDNALVSRRGFLGAGFGLAAAGIAALGPVAPLPLRAGEPRSVSPNVQQILPKGTLILMGGSAEKSRRILEYAQQIDIPKEKLDDPVAFCKALLPEQIKALIDLVDHAGLFNEINKIRPFEGQTVVCVTSAAATSNAQMPEGKADPEKAKEHAWLDQLFFRIMGAKEVVTIATRGEANDPAKVAALGKACMIYFDGGWQDVLAGQFMGTKAYDVAFGRYLTDSAFTIAGSSAGAAVMAGKGTMIKEWDSNYKHPVMGVGFGFLGKVIPDTHIHGTQSAHLFGNVSRLGRLQEAIDSIGPDYIGLGIEERTGVVLQGDKARVIGEQFVTKLDSSTKGKTAEELENKANYKRGDIIDLGANALVTVTTPVTEVAIER